jgi:hypothetical protein
MHKERTLYNIYSACEIEGSFIPLIELDVELIKSIFNIARADLETADKWAKAASKDSEEWNAIFKLYYDALHGFGEALTYFAQVKTRTHECLFAYLCSKYSELELNWDFLEEIRTKRNGIHYYGRPVGYSYRKKLELQMKLHLSVFKKAVEEKLAHEK